MSKKITEATIQAQFNILEQTVPRIKLCTNTLDELALQTLPNRGEWSAKQVLAHIRSCAEVWGYSIYTMLIVDAPEITFIHPRTWSKFQKYETLGFEENLLAFDIQRQNLLRKLNELPFEDWGRSARFTGKVNIHTVFSQARRMAQHELGHCEQIEAIVNI